MPRIRRATPDDAGTLVDLMQEFHAESDYALDREPARDTFLKLLARPDLGCVLMATVDDTASGYVVLTLRYTMEHGALGGHIDDLFVRPAHRRQGIGFALLSELLAECRHRDCKVIYVEVGNDNASAIGLYRRLGLEEFHDGRILLHRNLGASDATIRTRRLDLVPMTPSFLRACLEERHSEASDLVGMAVPGTWSAHEAPLALRLSQLEADPALQPWLLRAIGLRGSGEMIGYIGFHTAPEPEYLEPWLPGAVEFGFTIFPDHRGNGYALEASKALMQWAEGSHGVTRFVLTISPTNFPSQAIASRLGFVRIGEHLDEVDGIEHVLALVTRRGHT